MLEGRVLLEAPERFLPKLPGSGVFELDLDRSKVVQPWALAGLAALARADGKRPARVVHHGASDASRFAHAIGFDDVVAGRIFGGVLEAGRTVPMLRFSGFRGLEQAASKVARLVLPKPGDEDSRLVVQYVIVELLRNVVQHSRDPLGGVVVAQRMGERQRYASPCVQVAVADAGLGIFETMRGNHPDLTDARAALEKSLRPHISGSFEEGLSGSGDNAGMGLFFISEMAKLAVGRLLLASRAAALEIRGNPRNVERPTIGFVKPAGVGYPGTLVAFELPLGKVLDYQGLIEAINQRARERSPQRAVYRWVRFDEVPAGARRFLVSAAAEDTTAAQVLADRELVPRLLQGEAVVLDFSGLEICTQSFLHALLFRPIRIAWAERRALHVVNADPAVRSGVETVQQYALGG